MGDEYMPEGPIPYRGFAKSDSSSQAYHPPARAPGERACFVNPKYRAEDDEGDRGTSLRLLVDLHPSDHRSFSLLGLNPHENPQTDANGTHWLSSYTLFDNKTIAENKENSTQQAQALGTTPKLSVNSSNKSRYLHDQDPYYIKRQPHDISNDENNAQNMDDKAIQRRTPVKNETMFVSKQQETKDYPRTTTETINGSLCECR